MTYFGVDVPSFSLQLYRSLAREAQKESYRDALSEKQRAWLKTFLVRAVRHMALTEHPDRYNLAATIFKPDLLPLL